MPTVTYDTNVFIDYNPAYFPAGFHMSAVVIQELAAGALDNTRLAELRDARRQYEEDGRLLVPTGEDWYIVGKVLNSLYRGQPVKKGARRPAIDKEERRIVRDVLIARTAKRAGATVITKNESDFAKIRPYCAVRTQHPDKFLIK